MNARTHARSPSHGRKNTALARTSRSSQNNRSRVSSSTAVNELTSQSRTNTRPTLGRGGKTTSCSKASDVADDEIGGMESFLQYCATCERQIVTPGNSILYCSEACRRKDVSRSAGQHVSASLLPLNSSTSIKPDHYHRQSLSAPKPIVAPRSPTILRPASSPFADSFLSASPLNPTEAEEAYFLTSQFPCDPWSGVSASYVQAHRTSVASTGTIPSLSHTPSSSVDTTASLNDRPDYTGRKLDSSSDVSTPCTSVSCTYPSTLLADSHPSSLKSRASTSTTFRVAEAGSHIAGSQSPSSTTPRQRKLSTPSSFAHGSLQQLYTPATTVKLQDIVSEKLARNGPKSADMTSPTTPRSQRRGKGGLYFI